MRKYKVYVGGLQDVKNRYQFYSSDDGYMAVYADRPPAGAFERADEERLPEDIKKWLSRCKLEINSRYMRRHIEEYADIMRRFTDTFETELQKAVEENGGKKDVKETAD